MLLLLVLGDDGHTHEFPNQKAKYGVIQLLPSTVSPASYFSRQVNSPSPQVTMSWNLTFCLSYTNWEHSHEFVCLVHLYSHSIGGHICDFSHWPIPPFLFLVWKDGCCKRGLLPPLYPVCFVPQAGCSLVFKGVTTSIYFEKLQSHRENHHWGFLILSFPSRQRIRHSLPSCSQPTTVKQI